MILSWRQDGEQAGIHVWVLLTWSYTVWLCCEMWSLGILISLVQCISCKLKAFKPKRGLSGSEPWLDPDRSILRLSDNSCTFLERLSSPNLYTLKIPGAGLESSKWILPVPMNQKLRTKVLTDLQEQPEHLSSMQNICYQSVICVECDRCEPQGLVEEVTWEGSASPDDFEVSESPQARARRNCFICIATGRLVEWHKCGVGTIAGALGCQSAAKRQHLDPERSRFLRVHCGSGSHDFLSISSVHTVCSK